MATLRTTIRFWAFVAAAALLLALWCVVTGQWGSVAAIAWLVPGTGLLTGRFLSFAIVSVVFLYAGIVLGRNAPASMGMCGTGFLLAMVGFVWFAQEPITTEDVVPLLIFFVGPALTYLWGAQRCMRVSSEPGASAA